MPLKKKLSLSPSKEKSSETSNEVEVKVEKKVVKAAPKKALTPRRPVSLKYLSAEEFLLRKGTKPNHIPIYIAKAKSLGYTRATASEWDELLFGKS